MHYSVLTEVLISVPYHIILEDSWVRLSDFFDTDSSESEEEVVPPVRDINYNNSSITGAVRSTGTPVDTKYSTNMKNIKNPGSEPVLNVRGNSDSNFIETEKVFEEGDMDYVTYAIKDVELIDNVDFDDTNNSVLEDELPLDEFEV